MNSRVSWSIEGIDPSVRERAEAAARRAGMSLNEWLNSTVGDSGPPPHRSDLGPVMPGRQTPEVADIHQRLDSITRQIEQISRPAPRNEAPRGEQAVARQLNDAILRLDARLSQISNPASAVHTQHWEQQRQADMVERAAAQVYRSSPPLSPTSLDLAVEEITARQRELDRAAPAPVPPRRTPAAPAAISPALPPSPDFSSLERHLLKITSQIEALQRPDGVEQSIAAFRGELADIRHAITEAMPRRAIESIENEIRSLSRRIDDTRQNGIDTQALAGIERALSEIREVLRSLTPAEQLAGYDEAIRNLGAKLDLILRANDDPSTVHQLEGAIAALRAIVSNVASNDALARLSADVQTLSSKVDQLARSEGNNDGFAILEQRIAALTSKLEARQEQGSADNGLHLENALRALSDRIDRMPVGNDNVSAFAHLEQRVSYLLERVEASAEDRGSAGLGRVEDGLQDILHHLETQHALVAALNENRRGLEPAPDGGLVDVVKRELSDIRFSQAQTDRLTQDSLETVHNTLGHVVDRLAMIEGDLRAVRTAPVAAMPEAPALPAAALSEPEPPPRIAMPPQAKPELPNPAAAQPHFAAAPREFHALPPQIQGPATMPAAISEILEPLAARPASAAQPELAPDHPLEPGTRPTGRLASPSERIAMSESAISGIPSGAPEKASTSSFIAAARRAAQAAAAAAPPDKNARGSLKSPPEDKAGSTITSKIRSLLVAASVVVIVLGSFKMAMTLLDGGPAPELPPMERSGDLQPSSQQPADSGTQPAMPDQMPPSMTSPVSIGRQSRNVPAPVAPDSAASMPIPQVAPASRANGEVTGSIVIPQNSSTEARLGLVQVPPSERLPELIGGTLRAAALKGDAAAAYELGVRFAEGKGIAANLDEAAKWYDRAAQAGVVPAIFRLGTFYEKGLSVKKDVDIARRYYLQAAERGNAKAMHNLAVLEADGAGKGANYKTASQWFRKAADRGVADSQFNLGILYARGIGVEQNLAESFKWFSLAAAQGDADAGRKRDDIANRLDPQSLAAAKLAIQTFTPEPQPDDAVKVATPAGGWDASPGQPNSAKLARPASIKRAAAH
jgi:localization factor PodJL